MSKNGKFYWKNDSEVNREAQKKSNLKYYAERQPLKILKNIELGAVPQFASISKFPDILTKENILGAFSIYKEREDCKENKLNKMNMLLLKIESM